MSEFRCTVCGEPFSVPEAALKKFPGWKPKYCREHSPRRGKADGGGTQTKSAPARKTSSATQELDLPVAEVLQRFTEGPRTGIFTDGSARPNPGPGGWGAVYVYEGSLIEQRYGSEPETTNNRMELTALIEGFKMIPKDSEVDIYTDSELCVNIITKWARGWRERGWKRKEGEIKNLDLVKEAYKLAEQHVKVRLQWIKAHNGWLWNEYADSLATAWAREVF